MAARVPARLSPSEGRRFGVTVGIAFLVLAAIVAWRNHDRLAIAFGVVGAALGLAGLVIPAQLGPVQSGWMRFALALSKVTTPIIMGIAYFLVITPIGLVRRVFGARRLARPASNDSYWVATDPAGRGDMNRQF